MLTLPEVRKRVKALAEERPDYKYQIDPEVGSCVYFNPNGSPSCIVGHALATELTEAGISYGEMGNSDSVGQLRHYGIKLSDAAADWLGEVQGMQDSGTPWGEAVRLANVYTRGRRS